MRAKNIDVYTEYALTKLMRTLRKKFSLSTMSGGFKGTVFRKESNREYKQAKENKLHIFVLVFLPKKSALCEKGEYAKRRKIVTTEPFSINIEPTLKKL
jgi:hypothetical protein